MQYHALHATKGFPSPEILLSASNQMRKVLQKNTLRVREEFD